MRNWADGFEEALAGTHAPGKRRLLLANYRNAFPIDYREVYPPATAVADIQVVETLTAEHPLGVELYRSFGAEATSAGLKVFSHSRPIALSERVPVLENMGFRVVDERTYHIEPQDGADVWFHDMTLESAIGESGAGQPFDLDALREKIEACFLAVMGGRAENDGYNALVLATGLVWLDVALIRTLSRFLRQVRVPFSQDYMWTTLRKHAGIAALIVTLFHTRFDPKLGVGADERAAREAAIAGAIETALQAVDSLDEDRILRRFVNAVQSAIRTNFYQLDHHGHAKDLIAVKFSSRKLDDMPLPRPLYEIFVYSPRVEGVHLRFGKVARGGIRWSDRPQDFRTEVLGLVKAQNVKNAVIVPVGAKGGFVPKRLPRGGAREAIQAEGTASYKLFISTLLDITDNIGTGTTASFRQPMWCATMATIRISSLRRTKALRRSPTSPTASPSLTTSGSATPSRRVAPPATTTRKWASPPAAPGNRSSATSARWTSTSADRTSRLSASATCRATCSATACCGSKPPSSSPRSIIATSSSIPSPIPRAPSPSASACSICRARAGRILTRDLISKGGGVYSRSAKEIRLSEQAQKLFGVGEKLTPQELIRAILKAQVDLLFFGGIGTYVRAADESDEAAGDRANDPIRVAGADLRCKVIGEGANLGMTQRGRIEAALRGVRLNTDAIDNSAGVNTSDMEVNIKIALSIPVRDGRLQMSARNALLGADDRRSRRARAPQQLPADVGAIAVAAARHGGFRLSAAGYPDAGEGAVCSIAPSSIWRTIWRWPNAGAAWCRSRGRSFQCCSPTPS